MLSLLTAALTILPGYRRSAEDRDPLPPAARRVADTVERVEVPAVLPRLRLPKGATLVMGHWLCEPEGDPLNPEVAADRFVAWLQRVGETGEHRAYRATRDRGIMALYLEHCEVERLVPHADNVLLHALKRHPAVAHRTKAAQVNGQRIRASMFQIAAPERRRKAA